MLLDGFLHRGVVAAVDFGDVAVAVDKEEGWVGDYAVGAGEFSLGEKDGVGDAALGEEVSHLVLYGVVDGVDTEEHNAAVFVFLIQTLQCWQGGAAGGAMLVEEVEQHHLAPQVGEAHGVAGERGQRPVGCLCPLGEGFG